MACFLFVSLEKGVLMMNGIVVTENGWFYICFYTIINLIASKVQPLGHPSPRWCSHHLPFRHQEDGDMMYTFSTYGCYYYFTSGHFHI